jgi:hypothetical protein
MPLTERDRKTLIIGGVIAGVILVGVLLMNLLGGGGEDAATPTPAAPTGATSPSTSPTPEPTQAPIAVFAGRDPFSVPPGFGITATTSPPPTSGTTSPPPTSGTTSPPPTSGTTSPPPSSGTTSPPPTGPGNGSSGSMGGHTVVLLDTYVRNGVDWAQIEVDGQVYRVAEGGLFGPSQQFRLQSVAGSCVTVLFGDESSTFCFTPQK